MRRKNRQLLNKNIKVNRMRSIHDAKIIHDDGGSRSVIFDQCDYLPFDDNSFVWDEWSLCYGQSMYQDMADGASTVILGDLVGPQTFGNPKVLVIYQSISS